LEDRIKNPLVPQEEAITGKRNRYTAQFKNGAAFEAAVGKLPKSIPKRRVARSSGRAIGGHGPARLNPSLQILPRGADVQRR